MWTPDEVTDTRLTYENDTEQGSSGAPIFNNVWQLVGIHCAGDGHANYGCRLSAVLQFIHSHPGLVQRTRPSYSHEG
jgi:V8-like Glu-specific endopeptidase